MGEQVFSLVCRQCPDGLRRCGGNTRHQERPIHQIIDAFRAPRCEQTTVSSKQGIGSRIKQISPKSHRHRKQHRMSAPEHVNGPVWRQMRQRRHHDFCIVFVTLLFHHRNDTANRVDRKVVLTHMHGGQLTKITVNTALDGTVEHGVFSGHQTGFCSAFGFLHRFLHFFSFHVRAAEHVKHGRDVHANGSLELHDVFYADLHVAVNIGLKRPRIRHYDAGIIQ